MQYGPVADYGTGEDVHTRIDNALLPYFDILPYGNIIINLGAVADVRMPADRNKVPYPNLPAKFCTQGDAAASAVAAVASLLRIHIIQKLGKGAVCAFDTDHCGSDRGSRLEIIVYQKDGSLAGIDIMLVFGICIEAKLTGFAVFDFGEGGHSSLRVSFYSAVQDFCQLFCSKFHYFNS